MRPFTRKSDHPPDAADFIKMLERASFEERERIRVLLDAVAVVEKEGGEPTGRPNVLVVSYE